MCFCKLTHICSHTCALRGVVTPASVQVTFQHQAPVVQFIALPTSIRDDGPGDSGAWVGHDEGVMWESQGRAVDPCNTHMWLLAQTFIFN